MNLLVSLIVLLLASCSVTSTFMFSTLSVELLNTIPFTDINQVGLSPKVILEIARLIVFD